MIIVGDGALVRPDAHAILSLLYKIIPKYKIVRENWNGFNILHNHASMVGALDLGFVYGNSGTGTAEILKKTQNGEIKILYLLGADDIDISQIGEGTFVIYQGHHGDVGANRADVILPEAAYTEQDGIYVNMEGRPQFARAAVSPAGSAKTGIEIINMVAEALGLEIKADELHLIRKMMAQEYDIFNHIDEIMVNDFLPFKSSIKLSKHPLEKVAMNYYMTDPISRASVTMAKCTKAINEMKATEELKETIEGAA
jgi:NADH-quinone oxidoreductase subunit G